MPDKNNSSTNQHARPPFLDFLLIKVDTTMIAASFLSASAVCYIKPELAASIWFLFLGMGLLLVDPNSLTKPISKTAATSITESLNYLTSKDCDQETTELLQAMANAVSTVMESQALKQSFKSHMMATLTDQDLHKTVLDTLHRALMQLSEDNAFLETTLLVIKNGIVGAMSNEQFVQEMTKSTVGAIVAAIKEVELTQNMLDVITTAVSKAFEYVRFVGGLRNAMKDTLKDGSIYRAGTRGMFSAVLGSGSDNNNNATTIKEDEGNKGEN